MMDNTTAISYINKMGGPTSLVLSSLAFDLWLCCLERSITVEAHHLPGRLNIVADFESRGHPDTSDWQLDPSIFQRINNKWGPFTIHLFCKQTDSTATQACELETRSRGRGSGCLYSGLKPAQGICIPSICPNRAVSEASSAAVSLSVDNCGSSLGNSTVVPVVIRNVDRQSHVTPILPRTAETRERATSSSPPSTSRLASLRSRYEGSTVSQPAQRLLLAAWSSRTEKNLFFSLEKVDLLVL